MPQFVIERKVNAPHDAAWAVIADVEAYADLAPNLSKAQIETGQGLGLQRRCWDTRGGTWTEQCTLWNEGHAYSMQVDTSDYPYPFTQMQGTWSVDSVEDVTGESYTLLKMQFDYQMKYGPIGILIEKFMLKRSFGPICEKLLDNWEEAIQKRTEERSNQL